MDVPRSELLGRDVDRHRHRLESARLPLGQLRAGLGHDDLANLQYQAAALGQRDEFQRRDQAQFRMDPAHQRFHAAQFTGARVDARLVVQLQLVAFDCFQQAVLQARARLQPRRQSRIEEAVLPLAFAFARIHGNVAVLDQALRIVAIAREQTDAYRRTNRLAFFRNLERPSERLQDTLRYRCHLAIRFGRIQQHDEFVATEAHHVIARAQQGFQAHRSLPQQQVAGRMALRIVDVLEFVQVDEQQRQRRAARARLHQRAGQEVAQPVPVRQRRQPILVGQPLQVRLVRLALTDVLQRDRQSVANPNQAAVPPGDIEAVIGRHLPVVFVVARRHRRHIGIE